jgi:hypothetical protein
MVYFNNPKDLKNLQTALLIYKRKTEQKSDDIEQAVATEDSVSPNKKIKS